MDMRLGLGLVASAAALALAPMGAQSAPKAAVPAASAAQDGIPQGPLATGVLERDLRLLMDWFPGEFDNAEQIYFAQENGYPTDSVPDRIHSIFKPVALPQIGTNVFYVQQYSDNDPAKIYRQRIYVFTLDKVENAVRLDIYTPKDVAKVKDAHLNPGKLAGLTLADLDASPGCEVYWRRQANQFVGYMKPGACHFKSKRTGKNVTISDSLILTENEIWIADQAHDDKGGYVFGNKAGISSKLQRAHEWNCWLAAPREQKNPDGSESWFYASNIKLSDQGGQVFVSTDEPKPRQLGYRLRQVDWPTGTNANALTLYALKDGDPKAVSYAWADPKATRIGINLRWMQGSCSR